MTSTTNRDLCRFFYAAAIDHYYACNYCGTRRKQLPSSGYANLFSHLKDKHPNYVEDYAAHQLSQAGSLSAFGFVNPTAVNMYRWMAWVVDRNMPLSEVDDPITRAMSALDPTRSKTLKLYLATTQALVEGMIGVGMPGVCGAMYDGLTGNLEHYVALFGVFCKNGKLEQPLLAIAPKGEGDLTAPAHCAFITRVFEKYNCDEARSDSGEPRRSTAFDMLDLGSSYPVSAKVHPDDVGGGEPSGVRLRSQASVWYADTAEDGLWKLLADGCRVQM